MVIGAVAQVLEDVLLLRERRLSDPGDTFRAHVGHGLGAALRHPDRHAVTADTGPGAAAVRHLGGAVVGTAGTEERCAHGLRRRGGEGGFLGLDPGQALLHRRIGQITLPQPFRDRARHHRRRELTGRRHQGLAAFVGLADHTGATVGGDVIEQLHKLILDQPALLLHHDDFFQPFGKLQRAFAFQRPGQGHLVDAHAHLVQAILRQAEIRKGLAQVQIALPRRHDADARGSGRLMHDAVEMVRPREGCNSLHLRTHQAGFLHHGRVAEANVQPARRHLEIGRYADIQPVRIDMDGGTALHGLGNRLESGPGAGIARHGKTQHAEVQIFLHAGRIQYRNHRRLEHLLRLVGQGGGLAAMVVTGQHQHTAMLR